MRRTCAAWTFALGMSLGVALQGAAVEPPDLSGASVEELLRVYGELRHLRASDQWVRTENVVWKRDAATFTFVEGRLTLAAPVAGRVLAAVFEGKATIALTPPTPVAQRQLARFTKAPKLEDSFRHAVFLLTDTSWLELAKSVRVQSGGDTVSPSKALESTQSKYSEDFNDWWENERKGNPQMRNLAARVLADLSDPTSKGFFLADFKGDRYGDLLYHISWNRDLILLPRIGNDEEVMLLHVNRGHYFEWWSGFHLAEEYIRTSRPEHRQLLAHCRREVIDAEVGNDKELAVTAEMEFEVPGGPARMLPFGLRGVLRISSVSDADGKKVAFIQEDRKLDNDPWLILSEPAKSGQVYKVRIAYKEDSTSDSRIIYQRGPGLYYVTSRESWFPSFGAFDDRTKYVMRMRSPKKFKFVGTGRQVKSEMSKEFLNTEWESEIPYSVVGFNYGNFADKSQSDANLVVTAYGGKEIPDELKEVQAALDMADFAGGPGGTRNTAAELGMTTGGFNTASQLGYAAGLSYQALELFEYYFGLLPFKAISVTEQPVRGYGQSWPTLIFLPYDSLLDSTTRQGLRLQESAEALEFYNIVAVHEMAHQWWGHLVGWKTYHDQWLSEGFAEFSAALYLRKFEPKKVKSFWKLKRKHLLQSNRAGHRPVEVGSLWLGLQLPSYLESDLYTDLVYYKGAYVLEMLRVLMEDPRQKDPDARFIGMMREFVSTYSAKNASTEDFRRLVEKHMGAPMDWFFDEWVYGTEVPQYDFKYQIKDGPSGQTIVQMSVTQSGVSDSFQMRVPVYVYVKDQPRRLGLVQIRGSSSSSGEVQLPFRPEKVVLDEYNSILCTIRQ